MQVKVILPTKAVTGVENTLAGRAVDLLFVLAAGLARRTFLELNLDVILLHEHALYLALSRLIRVALHLGFGLGRRLEKGEKRRRDLCGEGGENGRQREGTHTGHESARRKSREHAHARGG